MIRLIFHRLRKNLCCQTGSITVFLALTLVGIIILQITIGILAGRSLWQNILIKALDQQVEYNLSLYDRLLKERFGILAVAEVDNGDVFKEIITEFKEPNFYKRPSVYYEATLKDALSENSNSLLEDSITSITTLRGSLKLVENIRARFSQMRKESINVQSMAQAKITEAQTTYSDLEASLNYLDKNDDESQDNSDEYAEDRTILREFLNNLEEELVVASELDFKEEKSNIFNDVFTMVGKLENYYQQLLHSLSSSHLNIVNLLLYSVHNFSFHTAPIGNNAPSDNHDYNLHRYLLSGNKRTNYEENTTLSTELIVTDKLTEQEAFLEIKQVIWIARLLTNIYALHQYPTYNQYFSMGRSISAIVSLITLGNINIPPEAIATLIIVVRSLFLAQNDLQLLISGKSVELIPEVNKFPIYYSDFLYLRGMFNTKEAIVKRIGREIEKIMDEEFYFSVEGELFIKELGRVEKYNIKRNILGKK